MDTDEKLIHLVRRYECLFNTKEKYYSDKHSKAIAWRKISSELELPVTDCQKRWKELRDCFKKALRLRQHKSNASRTNLKPIKFEKELDFLVPHLQDKTKTPGFNSTESSLDMDVEGTSVTSPQSLESLRQESYLSKGTNRNKTQPLSQLLLRQYIEAKEKEEDPLDGFFLSMSRSVKKMPIQVQVELKRAILNLVTDAEIRLACGETNEAPFMMVGGQQQTPTIGRSFQIPSTSYLSSSSSYQIQPAPSLPTEIGNHYYFLPSKGHKIFSNISIKFHLK